ncbi:MAG: glycerophosphodiester phosphodiesterase [Gemmatimonadota bacterium]
MHAFFDGRPLVFAHRGASLQAPANTEVAFRRALEAGAHGLEADLRASRDGVAVVFHDPTVELRTDGSGAVAQRSYDELRALDAGYRWSADGGRTFPYRGRGLRLLRAESLLRAFPDVRFIFHIKSRDVGAPARRAIEAAGAADRVLVAAEWRHRLRAFRDYPGPRGLSTEEAAPFVLACWLGLRMRARHPFLAPPRRFGVPVLSPRFVACAHAAGQPVVAYVINEAEAMQRCLRWGVDAIETDRADVALDQIREWRNARSEAGGRAQAGPARP